MLCMAVLVTALMCVYGNLSPPISCEEARFKCARREGCGTALRNYVTGCSSVLQGYQDTFCPEICQHSLIALTSTDEGKELMRCQCSDNFCEDSKNRVEICRSQVMVAIRNETVLPCKVAHMICQADAACATALEYYNHYCKLMFHGKKCTHRCRNSLSILWRLDSAQKLKTCKCDGREEFDCLRTKNNVARLCYHKKIPPVVEVSGDVETNDIRPFNNGNVHRVGMSVILLVSLLTLT